MTWLILPPQGSSGEQKLQFKARVGFVEQWASQDAMRAFNDANLSRPVVAVRDMPITRKPDIDLSAVLPPEYFKVLVYSTEDDSYIKDYEGPFPDAIFGAGYNWIVSDRLRVLLEKVAPGSARFMKVELQQPRQAPVPGDWFLLFFNAYADVLDEERSTLPHIYKSFSKLSVGGGYSEWGPFDKSIEPKLYARRSQVSGLSFWSGEKVDREAPLNLASVGFTYCTDEVMQCLKEEKITGFGPAYPIELIEGGGAETIARGSPLWMKTNATPTERRFVKLSSFSVKNPKHGKVSLPKRDEDVTSAVVEPNQTLPDISGIGSMLVVSEDAKHVLEKYAGGDCQFVPLAFNENADGAVYTDTRRFYHLVSNHFIQPFLAELSPDVSSGMHSDGELLLSYSGGGSIVFDARYVENIQFFEASNSGAGIHFISEDVYKVLIGEGITGFVSETELPLTRVGTFRVNES